MLFLAETTLQKLQGRFSRLLSEYGTSQQTLKRRLTVLETTLAEQDSPESACRIQQ